MDFVLLTKNDSASNTFMGGFSCNTLIATQPKFLVWLCLAGTVAQIIAMQSNSLVLFSTRLE